MDWASWYLLGVTLCLPCLPTLNHNVCALS